MPADITNQEFEPKKPEPLREGAPRQEAPQPKRDITALEGQDRERAERTEAEILAELQQKQGETDPAWQREFIRLVRVEEQFNRARSLALTIFNRQVLKPKGKEPLTLEQFDQMKGARLSAFFRDTETGQKWELILDHKQKATPDDDEGPGPRLKIFDYSPFGKRVLHELHDEEALEHYGDVYDIGWTLRSDGILNFDSRVNHNSLVFREFFREQNPRHARNPMMGMKQVNSLLERTINHPDRIRMSHARIKLPAKP